MSNIDKYTQFIAEQVRKNGASVLTEEIIDPETHDQSDAARSMKKVLKKHGITVKSSSARHEGEYTDHTFHKDGKEIGNYRARHTEDAEDIVHGFHNAVKKHAPNMKVADHGDFYKVS